MTLDRRLPQFLLKRNRRGITHSILIAKLSRTWKIPANFMFIGCPGQGMPHSLGELVGVRVIV